MDKISINAGTVSGEPFHKWYVYVRFEGHEFRAGPFGKAEADEVTKHYELLASIVRKSVQAELRGALGVKE